MFLVPKFTLQNYSAIMREPFQGKKMDRRSFADIVRLLCVDSFCERFASVDARTLSQILPVGSQETIILGGKSYSLRECIIAIKLLIPTLHTADYFFWNRGQGEHIGIDIILPKGTPISALQGGKVTRIKSWDGKTKNEGNCLVIQDDRGYFWGYEHLDRIDVRIGDAIAQGTQIGLCGATGNATQYHLHLQVDLPSTSPNPHWSTDRATIVKKTIDPLRALRAAFSSFIDLPYEAIYQDAIGLLVERGYIQGSGKEVFPDQYLQRYEMALLLYRILQKTKGYTRLSKVTTTIPSYSDVSSNKELDRALVLLWQYGLMKGDGENLFDPYGTLLIEQAMALLGRTFFGIRDGIGASRYQPHRNYFIQQGYLKDINTSLGKPILRKDLFLLLSRVI